MAGLLLSVAGSCALFQSVQAQFVDNSRDLILTFRKTGEDGSGDVAPIDFEVDIGQASIYYNATPGSIIPITAYSAGQLSTVFDNIDDLTWSVSGCVAPTGDNGDPSKPPRTLWLTDPWNGTSAPPAWARQSTYTQGPVSGHIGSIMSQANSYAAGIAHDSVTNTPTAVTIPTSSGFEAGGYLGPYGNFAGSFEGDVENTTSGIFIYYAPAPSESDFYELQPGSGTGTYLGNFQLAEDGSMTFNAASTVVTYPAPTLSVTKSSGNVNVSFQSTANGIYTLHYTSAAGLKTPVSSWSTVSTNIIGDGTVKTFQQPISGTAAYYSVSVN